MNHNMKKIVIIHGYIFINGLWYIAGSDLLLLKGVVCFSDTYVLNSVKSQPHYQYGTPIFFQGQYKALLHCLGLFSLAPVECKVLHLHASTGENTSLPALLGLALGSSVIEITPTLTYCTYQ